MANNSLEFVPPEGTIDPKETEGEAMVTWRKKPDGGYCIVEFEGKPVNAPSSSPDQQRENELDVMDKGVQDRGEPGEY